MVALNEESNGDVNKNTENGVTKMMTDLNGSSNGKYLWLILAGFITEPNIN